MTRKRQKKKKKKDETFVLKCNMDIGIIIRKAVYAKVT